MARNQYKLLGGKLYKLYDPRYMKPEPNKVFVPSMYQNDMVSTTILNHEMHVKLAVNIEDGTKKNESLRDEYFNQYPSMLDTKVYTMYESYLLFINYVIIDANSMIKDNSVKCIKLDSEDYLNIMAATSTDELSYTLFKVLGGCTQISVPTPITMMRGSTRTWKLAITSVSLLGADSLDDTQYGQLIDSSQDNTSFGITSYIMDELKADKIAIYDSIASGKGFPEILFDPGLVNKININFNYVMKGIFEVADPTTVENYIPVVPPTPTP